MTREGIEGDFDHMAARGGPGHMHEGAAAEWHAEGDRHYENESYYHHKLKEDLGEE
jgi:hypothetical protein